MPLCHSPRPLPSTPSACRAPVAALACLLLCLSCLFAIPAHAAPVSDPAVQGATAQVRARAADLLKTGQAEEAYAIYKSLLLNNPDDDEAVLGLARAGAVSKHWNQSVTAYEMLLEKYPNTAALHGELARLYMLLGEREAAERSLAEAKRLGGGTELNLDAMEKKYSQVQIHGRLRAGLLYDSNVNMGPDTEGMELGSWHITVPGVKRQDSFGTYFGFDLDFGWQPLRDTGWWLVGDVRGLWRGSEQESLHEHLNIRESQWARAGIGVRHVGAKTLLDLRVREEIFDYEFLQHVRSLGPELTFVYAPVPKVQLITSAGLDSRKYSEAEERNGCYGWAGEYVRLLIGEGGHAFTAGGRILWGANNVPDYRYTGWEGSARLLVRLPHDVELAPFASLTQEFYNGPATALEMDKRIDTRWRVGAAVTWHVNDAWALEASYAYTNNDSNCPLYDYNQHLVMTGVSWSF
ncbi:MAG: DUF560 domain-containing protein [Desulfovibrio sp.]|nr:DUF560 domain-containing protein [Desulfovibrio sp.]